jgi:hypothetical protein
MRTITKPEKVVDLADKAKMDSHSLSDLLSRLISGSIADINSFAICPMKGQEASDIVLDICSKCPNYLTHKFILLCDHCNDDDIEYLNTYQFKLCETKYLALAMITLTSYLTRIDNIPMNKLSAYHMLFEYILTVSKVYELMNPSGSARQKYLNDAEELLTSQPLDRSSDKYKYYRSVLYSVFDDIREGQLEYIQDMKKALDKTESFRHSKYDPQRDFYASLKGTAQRDYTGESKSLLSSCFEVDLLKDLVFQYDTDIGYISYYPPLRDGYHKDKLSIIRTILINNPGKFKPRIIHIGDNPTQDRCMYIHRRLKALLKELPEDVTSNQNDGREFLQQLTLEWFINPDPKKRIGIYCYDFSNATDTLDQGFQYDVLKFVFNQNVADFWQVVSSADKLIQDIDGNYHRYQQKCGQPQGLLGSFNAFALAHHFIFLMEMKIMGITDKSAAAFYRVLGDDSVSNSIEPESEMSEKYAGSDELDIPRTSMEMVHFDICKNFAGFKINYDKSESTHWNSAEAKLDFAKVTYRNGQLFTPIPFRLAMNYAKDVDSRLAVAIWRKDRKDPYAVYHMENILELCDQETVDIIKSGVVPFLKEFKDESLNYNDSWLSRLRYSTAVCHLNMALSFSDVKDIERTKSYTNIVEDSLNRLLTTRVVVRLDKIDPNHKVMRIWESNAYIMQLLNDIYDTEDVDEKFLLLACSTMGEEFLHGKYFDSLRSLGTIRRSLLFAKNNPDFDISEIFPDFQMSTLRKLTDFSETLMTRGITKRPREEVSLLKSIKSTLEDVNDVLGDCPATLGSPLRTM